MLIEQHKMAEDAREDDDWNKVLSGALNGGFSSIIPGNLAGQDSIKHADDAIDFEGEDELADEELPEEEEPTNKYLSDEEDEIQRLSRDEENHDWLRELEGTEGLHNPDMDDYEGETITIGPTDDLNEILANGSNLLDDQDVSINEDMPTQPTKEEILSIYFPDFKPGAVLKLNSLFGPKPTNLILPKPKIIRQCVPTRIGLDVEADMKNYFASNIDLPSSVSNVVYISKDSLSNALNNNTKRIESSNEQNAVLPDLVLASAEWDIDGLEQLAAQWAESNGKVPSSKTEISSKIAKDGRELLGVKRFFDEREDIYDENAEEAILEGNLKSLSKKAHLDYNDPNLLFVNDSSTGSRNKGQIQRSMIPTSERQLQMRYNISNDRAYDMLKDNYRSKVRATIGNLSIDHSMVALRLQSPHYKVKLSKSQLRSFHRPTFTVRPNVTIQFSKIKQRKKKRDKNKQITNLLSKTTDMSLGDSAPFLMLEYSEEFPLVLSNFGMGSKLINYYRKKNAEDTSRPKLPIGETHVLGVQDRSAFWNFGFVEPGSMVPTLYNQMIRAPVFQHKADSTDFLLVRDTGGGQGVKYYLRSIPQIFVVGQTFPVTQIPGPHSRKVTSASKNRLKMVVYRVLNKNEHHRLQVKDISAHFPDQNDMQNRQRLKEFMEYQRSGDDQGYWKIKSTDTLPGEDQIRSMISPEDIALLEAMQVGQQHLEDAGYGKTVDDDIDDHDGMSIEEQLAPWNISRNFINATQGKAMLQLHGEGDPSGRGLAFSFLRTSMKGGFRAQGESINEKLDKSKFGGHSYNVALQQKTYDDEIARIWYAQAKNLSNTKKPDHSWDEAESKREQELQDQEAVIGAPDNKEDDEMSLFSHASGQTLQQSKVLRITRFVRDENGTVQRKVEVVKDPNVIRAYVRRRHMIEDAQMAIDEIAPTNDEERNKRLRKILEENLARKQRNQDRRIARRGKNSGKGKSTTRRCATCGAVGHIRTNKSCPLYNEAFLGAIPSQQNQAAGFPLPN